MLALLNEVKNYLRVTDDKEDELITRIIMAAQSFAEHYLGYKLGDNLPDDIKLALYMHVAALYDNRGSDECPSESMRIYARYRKLVI